MAGIYTPKLAAASSSQTIVEAIADDFAVPGTEPVGENPVLT
jgi:hypothetical protein